MRKRTENPPSKRDIQAKLAAIEQAEMNQHAADLQLFLKERGIALLPTIELTGDRIARSGIKIVKLPPPQP